MQLSRFVVSCGGSKAFALLFLLVSIKPAVGEAESGRTDQIPTPTHLSTSLQPGLSSFVIRLPKRTENTITVLNQNGTADGRFSIAVSNRLRPANSPYWQRVDGATFFRHQRQFAVSLAGMEAKYVRLTFEVRRVQRRSN